MEEEQRNFFDCWSGALKNPIHSQIIEVEPFEYKVLKVRNVITGEKHVFNGFIYETHRQAEDIVMNHLKWNDDGTATILH